MRTHQKTKKKTELLTLQYQITPPEGALSPDVIKLLPGCRTDPPAPPSTSPAPEPCGTPGSLWAPQGQRRREEQGLMGNREEGPGLDPSEDEINKYNLTYSQTKMWV